VDNRLAVIDLGSNTFHLLVVDLDFEQRSFAEVFRQREYVYLAQSGIEELSGQALLRGHKCLANFKSKAEELGVNRIIAIGTSAIRSASNGQFFVESVAKELGLSIEVINGQREAELISKGIISFLNPTLKKYNLLIDIGGGSVELILTNDSEIIQYWSFDCGISVIRNKWTRNDPPSQKDLNNFENLMSEIIGNKFSDIENYEIQDVVGASGPFEIIESYHRMVPSISGNKVRQQYAQEVIQQVISSGKESRRAIRGMAESRHDLSMESMLILNYFINRITRPDSIIITQCALKEGVIAEQLNI